MGGSLVGEAVHSPSVSWLSLLTVLIGLLGLVINTAMGALDRRTRRLDHDRAIGRLEAEKAALETELLRERAHDFAGAVYLVSDLFGCADAGKLTWPVRSREGSTPSKAIPIDSRSWIVARMAVFGFANWKRSPRMRCIGSRRRREAIRLMLCWTVVSVAVLIFGIGMLGKVARRAVSICWRWSGLGCSYLGMKINAELRRWDHAYEKPTRSRGPPIRSHNPSH